MDVEVSDQVAGFIRCQSPEPRRFLRLALRGLGQERGDIKALEGPLNGFYRLRVRGYRVIFDQALSKSGKPVIRCLFAERRDIVYEVFCQYVSDRILGTEEKRGLHH